jgi:Spy/CpxP family protein refolding chaperone
MTGREILVVASQMEHNHIFSALGYRIAIRILVAYEYGPQFQKGLGAIPGSSSPGYNHKGDIMKSAVMERPLVAARMQLAKKRGILGLISIGALMERQSELDLSDDQLKKILAIRSDAIHAKAKITGDIRVARLDLIYSTAMNIGNIEPNQIRSAVKNIYNLRLERKAVTIDAFKKASEVLSSDQKDKLKELVQERLSDFEAAADESSH